jgi:hypothetical protein
VRIGGVLGQDWSSLQERPAGLRVIVFFFLMNRSLVKEACKWDETCGLFSS